MFLLLEEIPSRIKYALFKHFFFSFLNSLSFLFQAKDLGKGCEVVVATPGRIKDCLDQRFLVLNQCNYIILDEADRMMELGFEESLNAVLDAMPTTSLKSDNEEIAAQQEAEQLELKKLGKTKYEFYLFYYFLNHQHPSNPYFFYE